MAARTPDSARDFAALAFTVLLERVGTTARDLSRLRAELIAAPLGKHAPEARGLAEASVELERQGWLFGLLARELGSDVLFQRRERHGLDSALWLVREILAGEGIELRVPPLPELDTRDEACTAICAVIARCVHAAQIEGPGLGWSFERIGDETALGFEGLPGSSLQRALREGSLRISGTRLCCESERTRFFLPPRSAIWP